MTDEKPSEDIEPGWKGLSWLFFPMRWKWVHALMGHTTTSNPEDGEICSCGWKWD